jgi:hypothetical protein
VLGSWWELQAAAATGTAEGEPEGETDGASSAQLPATGCCVHGANSSSRLDGHAGPGSCVAAGGTVLGLLATAAVGPHQCLAKQCSSTGDQHALSVQQRALSSCSNSKQLACEAMRIGRPRAGPEQQSHTHRSRVATAAAGGTSQGSCSTPCPACGAPRGGWQQCITQQVAQSGNAFARSECLNGHSKPSAAAQQCSSSSSDRR